MSKDDALIAGWKTANDWRAFRVTLVVGGSADRWQEAFDQFFLTRLNLRYFNPIKILQENGTFIGEGFSILAIQCTLIEFLESTVQGIKYRHLQKGEELGQHEYSSSREVFISFLCNRKPFAQEFNQSIAVDFYAGVRCGLLHEARTKNQWRIWGEGPKDTIIDPGKKIVYRNNFQTALQAFITQYGIDLISDTSLQKAFIRKFEDLCE